MRFGLSGGTVAAVYILCTLLSSHLLGLAFQAALALGFAVDLATHFASRPFRLDASRGLGAVVARPAGRYLAIALTQYVLTALSTATLPSALGVSTDVVYLVTTVVLSASIFLLFRSRVFHAAAPTTQR